MRSIPVDAVTNHGQTWRLYTHKKKRPGLALGTSSSPSESEPANLERSNLRDMMRCRGGAGNKLYGYGKLLSNNTHHVHACEAK